MTNDIQQELKQSLRILTIATVTLYLLLAGLLVVSYIDRSHQLSLVRDTAQTTNLALCALRGDLESRIANAEQFLEDNPNGIPGLSAEAIRTSIESQRRTVDALSILQCGGGE